MDFSKRGMLGNILKRVGNKAWNSKPGQLGNMFGRFGNKFPTLTNYAKRGWNKRQTLWDSSMRIKNKIGNLRDMRQQWKYEQGEKNFNKCNGYCTNRAYCNMPTCRSCWRSGVGNCKQIKAMSGDFLQEKRANHQGIGGLEGFVQKLGGFGMNPYQSIGGYQGNVGMGGFAQRSGAVGMNQYQGLGGYQVNGGYGGFRPNMVGGGFNPNPGLQQNIGAGDVQAYL